jgi:hypothetical protein
MGDALVAFKKSRNVWGQALVQLQLGRFNSSVVKANDRAIRQLDEALNLFS